jgi:hypothetical protein
VTYCTKGSILWAPHGFAFNVISAMIHSGSCGGTFRNKTISRVDHSSAAKPRRSPSDIDTTSIPRRARHTLDCTAGGRTHKRNAICYRDEAVVRQSSTWLRDGTRNPEWGTPHRAQTPKVGRAVCTNLMLKTRYVSLRKSIA